MKKKVILVPDESNVYVLLISIQLRKMGFDVRSFVSDTDVLARVAETSPSLIFLEREIREALA